MPLSPAGRAALKEFEGVRLVAYPDPATGAEPITIGCGHTGGVKRGQKCTAAQAERWLTEDAADAEELIDRYCTAALTQGQRDALISIVFNVGGGFAAVRDGIIWLKNGKHSTLLRKLNAGDVQGAADEFLKWNRAGARIMDGLSSRRRAERAMFLADTA